MWWIDATLNLFAAAAFLVIALTVTFPLARTRQIPSNLLGTAAVSLLFAAALRFAASALQLITGRIHPTGPSRWAGLAAAAVASATGLGYVWLRTARLPRLGSALLYEDADQRHRQGLDFTDKIVQGLTVAQMALALDEREKSREAVAAALGSAHEIVSDLLAQAKKPLSAGDLVRHHPATLHPAKDEPERRRA